MASAGKAISGKRAKPTRRRILRKVSPQETIRIWLDSDVIERFRSTGEGWQSRINEALKKAKVG